MRAPTSWVTKSATWVTSEDPQQVVPELGAGERVGGDAAGVVVGEAADEPGPEDGEQGREADAGDGRRYAPGRDARGGHLARARPPCADVGHARPGPSPRAAPAVDPRQAPLPGRREDRVDARRRRSRCPGGGRPASTTGHGEQVVARDDLGDLVLVGEDVDRHRLGVHEVAARTSSGLATMRSRSESTPTRRSASSTT